MIFRGFVSFFLFQIVGNLCWSSMGYDQVFLEQVSYTPILVVPVPGVIQIYQIGSPTVLDF